AVVGCGGFRLLAGSTKASGARCSTYLLALRGAGADGSLARILCERSKTFLARCDERVLECLQRGPVGGGALSSIAGRRSELGRTCSNDAAGGCGPQQAAGSDRVANRGGGGAAPVSVRGRVVSGRGDFG